MEVSQDSGAMLPPGDYELLEKREREQFHALQEQAVKHLIQAANEFQMQYPHLRMEWKFQMDVYQTARATPSTVRYSSRVY